MFGVPGGLERDTVEIGEISPILPTSQLSSLMTFCPRTSLLLGGPGFRLGLE